MSYYEDMLRENSIIFNGIRRHSYSGVQFKDKDDIEFVENCTELKNKYNHSKSSSSLSSCIVGSTERKIHTNHPSHQFSSDVKYNFKSPNTSFNVKSYSNIESINTLDEKQGLKYPKDVPMPDSKYKIFYHEPGSGFTRRISCYFNDVDCISVHCDVCNSETRVEIQKNSKNIHSSCGHYVVCNECRGRDIRRLLRCVDCCFEILGHFPICSQDGNCVNSDFYDAFQTSICYRCGGRLKREICNNYCNRRLTTEYIQFRKDLKSNILVLVRNPIDFSSSPPEFGTIRPCSHHSFCNLHNTVVRGHGKYTGCTQCKKEKKIQK